MVFAEVMIEHDSLSLSRSFTYRCDEPVSPGCRVLVPFGRQKLTGLVRAVHKQNPDPDMKVRSVLEVIDREPVLDFRQMQLADSLARETVVSTMSIVHAMLPKALAARNSRIQAAQEVWVVKTGTRPQKLSALLEQTFEQLPAAIRLKEAKRQFSAYRIDALCSKGALRKEKRAAMYGALPSLPAAPWPQLNDQQKQALQILSQAETPVSLLHGVTGSGKTEVFFHLARQTLEAGKQVLILVPEISLTPMMEKKAASRFSQPVFSCHSRLSDSQMLSIWNDVRKAGPCVVIGTRKSLFLPFSSLGLIIMDEEHDSSYKQDSHPRYHAREAIQILGEIHQAPVVLSSATPSLESYARAVRHVYTLAALDRRAAGVDAAIHLVNLKEQRTWNQFSSVLIEQMQKNLTRKEKTLILLNRRGYLPTVRCLSCQEYLKCDECNVPLSYHKAEHALVCHVCGKRFAMRDTCPNCHSHSLSQDGQGTERLEETAQSLFPQARIIRMDHDTTGTKGAHERLLSAFEQDGDILMGTQMIAKGLDYHDVTLCGILSIDSILSRPDYLASEKTYQLAEQAAGRAGRGKLPGRVLIQTWNPDHFVLRCIARHQYREFFLQEMRYRHAGFYPPYSFLATVIFAHDDPKVSYNKSLEAVRFLHREGVEVLGPMEISMRSRRARFRLVVKDRNDDHLRDVLWKLAFWSEKNTPKCRAEINRHPVSLEE